MGRVLKRWLPWLTKGLLSAGITWYVLAKVDLAAVWQEIQSFRWVWLAAAAAVQCGQVLIGGRRWQVVVVAVGGHLSLVSCATIFYLSSFFNLVLPGAVGGDGFRMWQGCRRGLPVAQAVSSVMLERAATLLGLFLLVTAMEPLLAARIGAVPAAWMFPVLAGLGVAGLAVLMLLDLLPGRWRRLRVVRGLAALAGDARRTFLRPRPAIAVLAWAVAGHANLAVVVWLLAHGLALKVTMVDCLTLVPPVILMTTLPISIAGWGVREGAMVAAFHLVGVPVEAALALSLITGVVNTLVSLPAGVMWFASADRRVVGTSGLIINH